MKANGLLGLIYTIMEWITRIAYVNLLWILFSALGLLVLGLGPATVSMYAVTREWVMGRSDIKVLPLFWDTYRSEFLRSNLLLWVFLVVGYIIYIDYQYLANFEGIVYLVMLFILVNVTIIYTLTILYIFPVFVHYNHPMLQYFKHAFLLGVTSPFTTLSMLASVIVIGLSMERIPGLIPFFPACLLSLILMWFSYRAFIKMEKKSKRLST